MGASLGGRMTTIWLLLLIFAVALIGVLELLDT